jgi:hypothetical protein
VDPARTPREGPIAPARVATHRARVRAARRARAQEPTMARWTWITLGTLATAGLATVVTGTWRWRRESARVVAAIDAAAAGAREAAPFDPASVDSLPAPVRRYLRWAIAPGTRPVRRVSLVQTGTFAMRPGQWTRFGAEQVVTTAPRAFVWDARMTMATVVPVLVRDGYRGGQGAMLATIAGWAPVADAHDTPDMATGALLRWLAEAAWYPTAFLPSEGTTWTAIDDASARATITDGAATVALDVTFAADGGIARVRALRVRDGAGAPQPWQGSFTDYRRVDGMMVPMRGEVGWGDGARYAPYWRGRIETVRYDVAGGR